MAARDQNFPDFDIEQKSIECITRLDGYVHMQFDSLLEKFLGEFKQFCEKITRMQGLDAKGPIGFIHLSILRTNIMAKLHRIRLNAYDENWYMDRKECSGEYDVTEYYTYLDEFTDALEEAREASRGKITLHDVQSAVFEECNKYLLFVAELVRVGLKKASEEPWFQAMRRHEVFVICIGEYQDKVDILYKEDTSVKDARKVKRFLESKHQPAYSHEICNNLNLTGGLYEDICLQFSSFNGSDLSGSSFSGSKIICSSFQNAVLRNVGFNKAQVFNSDFSGAKLEDVSFEGAQLTYASFAGATLTRVRFEGVLLTQSLDFSDAKLIDTILPGTDSLPHGLRR